MEQPVVEPRSRHVDPFGQHEAALELPRGDAAMQEDALGIVLLAAAHHELVVLDRDGEIVEREAGTASVMRRPFSPIRSML